MRLSYFREFIVLSRYLNFSIAAGHLHMTQPGLSRHISALEKEIGIKLFERDTHKVRLTEKGKLFLKGIRKIVDDYDFLCEAVLKGGVERITIGVPYYGVKRYLSHVISSFESENPMVKINYLPAYPDAIITGLLSKQVDVAVLPKVSFRNFEKLVFKDAFKESAVLLVNRENPLAAKDTVKLADLKDEHFITLKGDWGDALFEDWSERCRRHGFSPPVKKLETDTIEEAALIMKPDNGVMLLPEHLKEVTISENITFIDIRDEDCFLTISLVYNPENKSPATQKFIRFYLEHAGS